MNLKMLLKDNNLKILQFKQMRYFIVYHFKEVEKVEEEVEEEEEVEQEVEVEEKELVNDDDEFSFDLTHEITIDEEKY